MPEGITVGDILQFGAMGVLCLVLWWNTGQNQQQMKAKDDQISKLTDALIESKLNSKALDIVTAQLQAVMPLAVAGAASVAVKAASASSEAGSERSGEPLRSGAPQA